MTWAEVEAARVAAHGPVVAAIGAASSSDVALAAIGPERWSEYNRKFNDLLMRGVLTS